MLRLICNMMCVAAIAFGGIFTTIAVMAAEGPAMTDKVVFFGPERLYSQAEVWQVWCDDNLACTLAGQPIDYQVLFQQMPVAEWGWCQAAFCYGDDALSDIIGLNPLFFKD